jgi:hypothetical protein
MYDADLEKNRFRMRLKRINEDGELDRLIEEFVYFINKHEIYLGPSKGNAGEDGKDVVAIEDRNHLSYCSYVIKKGHLNRKNLYGDCGILIQMRQALTKDLKDRQYHGKKRTAVVVHNGKVANNSYHNTFIDEKERLEDEMSNKQLLLRPIERWDLNKITDIIFPHAHKLRLFAIQEMQEEKKSKQEQINRDFIKEMESLPDNNDIKKIAEIAKTTYNKIKENESNYPLIFPKISE